ncbi:protein STRICTOSIDINE SYNTHASE-LIKE 10-like [Solanum verrucosum]|uniref:protein STRICTOSIDINE SYNTHASE-LIKE 10-like n=1 Tax=Solanum verrucosum TaxID=315347 RepID=UPI0020D0F7BF|nr:protein STRICTOSIDINE SYNTHASE-LIKE 10-like [Solanum verrucosum]
MVPPVLLTVNFQHLGSSNFHHESLALNLLLSIKKKKGDVPYTAVADGRIVKYEVDAYYGILVVGPTGGLATQLVTSFEGTRFGFLDALNIDQKTGVIYFVDAGAIFRIGDRTTIVESRDTSGRLFKYDIRTNQVTLLLTGLSGPVGLSLSKDSSYVLIIEYIAQRIRRFWLKGPKENSSDVFRKFEGIPDNIRRTVLGDFWEAIANTKQNITYSIGQRINQLGKVVETRHSQLNVMILLLGLL